MCFYVLNPIHNENHVSQELRRIRFIELCWNLIFFSLARGFVFASSEGDERVALR